MSGHFGGGPHQPGSETSASNDERNRDAFLRRFAQYFGLSPESVNYVCQIPEENDEEILWEFWQTDGESETTLQVRATRRRRLLPEKADHLTSEEHRKDSDSRHGDDA